MSDQHTLFCQSESLYDHIQGQAESFCTMQFGTFSHPDPQVNELFMKSTVMSYAQGWLDCLNEQRDSKPDQPKPTRISG